MNPTKKWHSSKICNLINILNGSADALPLSFILKYFFNTSLFDAILTAFCYTESS